MSVATGTNSHHDFIACPWILQWRDNTLHSLVVRVNLEERTNGLFQTAIYCHNDLVFASLSGN